MPTMAREAPAGPPIGRRIVVFVVIIIALAVLIGAVFGERGYLEVLRRRAAYADLVREVDDLAATNAALRTEIAALRSDPYVIEKLAREKLGYARPGEVIYLLPPSEDAR
ncbi:MAG: FtsB family cell division protein [Candidatus Polarisedimenticolia bacterium]